MQFNPNEAIKNFAQHLSGLAYFLPLEHGKLPKQLRMLPDFLHTKLDYINMIKYI